MSTVIDRKSIVTPFSVKSINDNDRSFTGLAAAYNLDLGGDVITKGAFDKTLSDWRRRKHMVPLLDSHSLQSIRSIVGKMVEAREVGDGLEAKFEVIDGPDGDEVFRRIKGGYVEGLSIGYEAKVVRPATEVERKEGIRRYLDEVKLMEVSVVLWPMNPSARIDVASAKSLMEAVRNRPLSDEEEIELKGLFEELGYELSERGLIEVEEKAGGGHFYGAWRGGSGGGKKPIGGGGGGDDGKKPEGEGVSAAALEKLKEGFSSTEQRRISNTISKVTGGEIPDKESLGKLRFREAESTISLQTPKRTVTIRSGDLPTSASMHRVANYLRAFGAQDDTFKPYKPYIGGSGGKSIETIRDFEAFLRDEGGFSNAEAKSIAIGGFKAKAEPRDEDEEADKQEPVEVAKIDPEEKPEGEHAESAPDNQPNDDEPGEGGDDPQDEGQEDAAPVIEADDPRRVEMEEKLRKLRLMEILGRVA